MVSNLEASSEEICDVAANCRPGELEKGDRDPICPWGSVTGPCGGLPGFFLREFCVPFDLLLRKKIRFPGVRDVFPRNFTFE